MKPFIAPNKKDFPHLLDINSAFDGEFSKVMTALSTQHLNTEELS